MPRSREIKLQCSGAKRGSTIPKGEGKKSFAIEGKRSNKKKSGGDQFGGNTPTPRRRFNLSRHCQGKTGADPYELPSLQAEINGSL